MKSDAPGLTGRKSNAPPLDEHATALAKPSEPNVLGFAIDRRVEINDAAFIARIKQVVLNPSAYRHYEGNKFCGGFQPKVVFRFGSGDSTVDVLLCFNCEDVAVSSARSRKEAPDFYPLATMKTGDWWALAKEAFPGDAFIQRQQPRH